MQICYPSIILYAFVRLFVRTCMRACVCVFFSFILRNII